MTADPDSHLYVHAPEDTLWQELRGFRKGNEVSDRQGRDVLGILLVQGDTLDRMYLRERAKRLGVFARELKRPGRAPSGLRTSSESWTTARR